VTSVTSQSHRDEHYAVAHDDVIVERVIVDSADDFIKQKKTEQSNECHRLSLLCKRSQTASIKTYICSAAQDKVATRKKSTSYRTPNECGVLRKGIVCTCFIRIRHMKNGKAVIEFCDAHTHLGDINMMPCDEATVNIIRDMLVKKYNTKHILDHFNKIGSAHDGLFDSLIPDPLYKMLIFCVSDDTNVITVGSLVRCEVINSTDVANVKKRFNIGKEHQLDKNGPGRQEAEEERRPAPQAR